MKISARSLTVLGAIAIGLSNLGRIPVGTLGGRTAPVALSDLITALICLVTLIFVVSGRARAVLDSFSLPALAFVLVAAISTALAVNRYSLGLQQSVGVSAFLLRWVMYFGWYCFVAWCLTADEARTAWQYIEMAILAFAAFGIVQSIFLPGFAQTINPTGSFPTWDVQGHRLVSSVLDPNFAGIFIVLALLFRLARIAEDPDGAWSPWTLLILTAAWVMTLSRSSTLALFVGVVVIMAFRGFRTRLSYLLSVGGALLVPTFFLMRGYLASFHKLTVDSSALQRLIPWSRALVLFMEHPVLGVGFNAALPAQLAHGWVPMGSADVSLDAGLLTVATLTGALGLACYLALLWNVARVSRHVSRNDQLSTTDRAHGVATAACTAAVVVHAFFVNSILLPFVMQMLWVMWGTLRHLADSEPVRQKMDLRRVAPLGKLLAVVPFLLLLGACDPCAGTNVCSTETRVDLIGQIVDPASGVPARNVIVRTDLPDGSSATAITDGNGSWEIVQSVRTMAPLDLTVTVTAPGHTGYTTPAINVTPVTRHGDATLVGAWYSFPYAHYQATMLNKGRPLAYATVTFQPTSGVPVTQADSLSSVSNGVGIFSLSFGGDQLGTVVGNLTVKGSTLDSASTFATFSIPLGYKYAIPKPAARFNTDPSFVYSGQVFFRGTGSAASGVRVKWSRTSGILTKPTTYQTTSDDYGFFTIRVTPLDVGDVVGTLTFTPPSGAGSTYSNIVMSTSDPRSQRDLGGFGFGQRWAWGMTLLRNDTRKPAAGIPVTFRRTGGVSIQPDTIRATPDASSGWFALKAVVSDTGEVDGELIVYPSSGPMRVITGLKLPTTTADEMPFAGVYGFGPSLHYAGRIMNTDSVGVPNARVVWTRESGLDATPSLTETTDSLGYFDFWLVPPFNTEGTVNGHLTVSPSAPYRAGSSYVVNYVSLHTFIGMERRFSYVFLIPTP